MFLVFSLSFGFLYILPMLLESFTGDAGCEQVLAEQNCGYKELAIRSLVPECQTILVKPEVCRVTPKAYCVQILPDNLLQ